VRERRLVGVDVAQVMARARDGAAALWARMEALVQVR
jgi:hypothetical protein